MPEIKPNLPEKAYRESEGVSQSLLKEFGEYSTPLHFQKRKPKKATADMEFGTVCHAAVLTPNLFEQSYYLRPDQYPKTPKPTKACPNPEPVMADWHNGSDYCSAWMEEHKDRPVITAADLERVHRVRERLLKLEVFSDALKTGQTEVAFYRVDETTGLTLKCRADLVATDNAGITWVFDMKKVQSGGASEADFWKSCDNFGYHIQCDFYLYVTGATRFVFVPFDDEEPFDARLIEPSDSMCEIGRLRWRSLLDRYATCVKYNDWPGYPGGITKLHPPDWVLRKEMGL